ncbi:hypothetical protein [Paraburkholderia hospita]|nr:hypothetical protein [Paraburkholderia hospita]
MNLFKKIDRDNPCGNQSRLIEAREYPPELTGHIRSGCDAPR